MSKNLLCSLLLIFLIIVWGLSWPVTKIALQDISPMWFTVGRLLIATSMIFVWFAYSKDLVWPSKQDWPLILSVGSLQIGAFLVCINLSVYFIEAGRAAILAYTTPLWVTPIAVFYFHEKFNGLKALGLLAGMLGLLLLLNPHTIDWQNNDVLFGNGFALLGALCWSVAMLHIRYSTWQGRVRHLLPWQLLVALLLVLICVLFLPVAPVSSNLLSLRAVLALGFTGVFSSVFAFWALFIVNRHFAVTTTSMTLNGVPVAGLFFSALLLGEMITLSLVSAMLLIFAGIVLIIMGSR
jgi:drug/metabolite transporter (DMT)-like permease